jgi:nucleoside phosphorylase
MLNVVCIRSTTEVAMNKTVAAAVMAALLLGTLTAAVVLVIGTAA